SRESLFVTTKVAAEHKDYKSAADGIDRSLRLMGLDYIDMMIIHSPQPWVEVNQSDDRYFEGNLEAWRALTDAYKAGKLRAIGVSNFERGDIDNIWNNAEVKPMVNQVLCHISNTPLDLIDYCTAKGIVMEAYSPVAHGEAMKIPAIAEMAKKYGVTVPQLCIRYDIKLGMIVLPKTANPDHMRSNAEVEFVISDEDMEILKHIERIKDYGDSSFFPVFGGKLKGYSGKPGTEEI
ncbi:MAG: aldo/keto reductase, partial [Oscillospiraceae bacterium]|nr:aldo/keto reductase [Oscillospiraceae bacterium]